MKRFQQPQGGAQIDWANPITKSLAFAANGANTIDSVSGTIGVLGAGTTSVVTQRGLSLKGNTSVSAIGRWTAPKLVTSTGDGLGDFTIALRASPSVSGARGTLITNIAVGTYESAGLFSNATTNGAFSSGSMFFGTYNAGWAGISFSGGVDGSSNVWHAVRRGTFLSLYRNGVLVAGPTSVALKGVYKAGQVMQLMGDSENVSYPGFVAEQASAWNSALSDAEIKSLSENPWQLYKAANSPIFVPVSGGSGSPYTLTADAGAIAITGNAAGLSVNRTLTADAGALAIDGNAATLAFNRALIADTANVAITGNAASLVFTPVGGPTYTLPADTAAVAISGAATSLVRGYNLALDAGAVSISASDAALIATRKLIADAYAAVIAVADATLTYTPITYSTIGRPASDTSNSGWTASTGTDLFAMLDEVTPDPLDYISTTAIGSICKMALNTTAYPGTASQQLKFQASSSLGNSVIVRLKEGATTIRTETQVLTATDTIYTITLTSGEIAAITSGSLSVELESA